MSNKSLQKTLFTIFSLFLIFNTVSSFAQCTQNQVYNCAKNIDSAVYLRDFNTRLKAKKWKKLSGSSWEFILDKGKTYRFTLCTARGYEHEVEMRFFDSKKNEYRNPINVSKETESGIKGFDYHCKKRGTYYLSIRYKNHKNKHKCCAVGILSFVGRN